MIGLLSTFNHLQGAALPNPNTHPLFFSKISSAPIKVSPVRPSAIAPGMPNHRNIHSNINLCRLSRPGGMPLKGKPNADNADADNDSDWADLDPLPSLSDDSLPSLNTVVYPTTLQRDLCERIRAEANPIQRAELYCQLAGTLEHHPHSKVMEIDSLPKQFLSFRDCLIEATKLDPHNIQAWNALATYCIQHNESHTTEPPHGPHFTYNARTCLLAALQCRPDYLPETDLQHQRACAWNELGTTMEPSARPIWAMLDDGQMSQLNAVDCFVSAVECAPRSLPIAWANLGHQLRATDRVDVEVDQQVRTLTRMDCLVHAAALDPRNSNHWRDLGMAILFQAPRKPFIRTQVFGGQTILLNANQCLSEAIRLNPEDTTARRHLKRYQPLNPLQTIGE